MALIIALIINLLLIIYMLIDIEIIMKSLLLGNLFQRFTSLIVLVVVTFLLCNMLEIFKSIRKRWHK